MKLKIFSLCVLSSLLLSTAVLAEEITCPPASYIRSVEFNSAGEDMPGAWSVASTISYPWMVTVQYVNTTNAGDAIALASKYVKTWPLSEPQPLLPLKKYGWVECLYYSDPTKNQSVKAELPLTPR